MKQIIVTENALLNNAVNLQSSDYKLPQFLYQELKSKHTSLGDNPCFPSERQYPYDYAIIKARYAEVMDKVQNIKDLSSIDLQTILNYNNKLIERCKEIEKPVRDLLNGLCKQTVIKTLGVPEDLVIFNCRLTDKVDPKHSPRIVPEDADENGKVYDFEDVKDIDTTNQIVLQRRFINSLIQGASYCLYQDNQDFLDEIYKIDSELPKLYKTIGILNDYILFNQKETIKEKNLQLGAYVDVMLGCNGNKTKIESQALIFPYLLVETYRGFFELFASHSLPNDMQKTKFIVRHSDFLMAESWDLRFGVSLWKEITSSIKNNIVLPYYFKNLTCLPTDIFNEKVKEILSQTKSGKQFNEELIARSEREITFEDVPSSYDTTENDMQSIIADDVENEEMLTLDEIKQMN